MALNSLERLMVQLGLDYSEFKKGRAGVGAESKGMADDIRQNMAKAGDGVGSFAANAVKSLAAPLAAFASVSTVVGQLRASIDRMDAVSDRVERLGIGAEKLQELSYYAEFSSVSIETLDGSIRTLSKNMAGAASGNKEQAALFKALGVQVVDANGKLRSADDVMRDVSGKFAGMTDGAGKTAIAMAVFGKSGAELLPMLNGGVEGMDKAAAKARELGVVMGEDVVADAARFNDSLDDLSRKGQGAFNNLAEVALPALIAFTEKILAATKGVSDFYREARGAGGVAAFFDDKLFGDNDPNIAIESAKKGVADAEKALKGLRERPEWLRSLTRFDLLVFGGEEAQYAEVLRRKQGMLTAAEARKAALAPKPVPVLPEIAVSDKVDPPRLPSSVPPTESEAVRYLKQIRERGAALLVESQSTDKLSQSQKDLAAFEQKLIEGRDGSFKVNEAAIRSQLDANIAAEKAIELRDKQIKADAAYAAWGDSLRQSEQGLRDGLTETTAAFGQSTEQRKIAAATSKIYRDAEKLVADQMRAGAPLTLDYVANVYALAGAQAEVTRELMGRQQAEEGAQQLYAENKRFGLEYIDDERERAAAVLQIEAESWQARIDLAKEGAEERKRLQEQFDIWYANQLRKPQLDADKKIRDNAVAEWGQVIDGVSDAWRDVYAALRTDGEGAGKAAIKALGTSLETTFGDALTRVFAKPFAVQLVAGIAGLSSGDPKLADRIVKESGATENSLFGNTSVLGKLLGGAKDSSYNALADNVAGASATSNAVYGAVTDWAWNNIGSGSEMMSSVAGAVMENSEAIAGFADAAGGVLAYGGAIMSALNGDFGAAIGGAIGAYFGGPIGSFIGSKIGALLDGPKTQPGVGNYGIAEIDQGGVVRGGVTDEEFFYGDRRGYKGVAQGLVNATSNIGAQIASLAALYGGDASGLRIGMQTAYSPDGKGANAGTLVSRDGVGVFGTAIEGTNDDLEKNAALVIERTLLGGLRESRLEEGFAEVLNGVNISDATQEVVDGLKAELQGVKDIKDAFTGLGRTLPDLADQAWQTQKNLVTLSGGLEQFKTNVGTYYQAFHSEEERAADSMGQMTAQLAVFGVELPKTREAYRALRESQNLATVSGQLMNATLFEMSGQFDAWVTYSEAAADAEETRLKDAATLQKAALKDTRDAWAEYLDYLGDETESARSGVLDAYTRESDALRNTISATEAYIDSLASLRSNLLLGDLSTLTPEQKYAQGKTDLDALIARAEAGDEEARGQVPQAIQQFLDLSRSYNASSEAYQRDFQQYLNTAERLRTSAASQLDISRSQLAKLDSMVAGILDVNKSVLSLPDALAAFLKAQADQAKPGVMPTTPAGLTALEKAINDAYVASDGRNADAEGLAFWRDAILNGADQNAILEQIRALNHASEYDGSHASGLAFVPKDNYRARLHYGERVMTAAENREHSAPRYGSAVGGGGTSEIIQAINKGWAQVAQEVKRQGEANLTQRAATHVEVRRLQLAQLDVRQQAGASV